MDGIVQFEVRYYRILYNQGLLYVWITDVILVIMIDIVRYIHHKLIHYVRNGQS